MPPAVRRSRSGRARAEAPASAAETSGALRSRHAIKKKKAMAETTAARAPLRTTIAIATLTDSARASPEKGAKPVARESAARARSNTRARSRTAPTLTTRNDRPFRARRAPPRDARRAARRKCRVYVLTYFFSSLTIDKQRALGVPFGWSAAPPRSGSASPSVTATCSCRARVTPRTCASSVSKAARVGARGCTSVRRAPTRTSRSPGKPGVTWGRRLCVTNRSCRCWTTYDASGPRTRTTCSPGTVTTSPTRSSENCFRGRKPRRT